MVREAYLKTEVAIPDFLAALKEANPDDAEYIDTKLKEYNNGELRAPAVSAAPLAPCLLGAPARRYRQTDPRFFSTLLSRRRSTPSCAPSSCTTTSWRPSRRTCLASRGRT